MAAVAIAALALCAVPVLQSRQQHQREMKLLRELKQVAVSQATKHHEETLEQARDYYNGSYTLTHRCYEESMALRVHLARRETMRDVWHQRNLLNQTLVIITGLMFSCAFEALSQGIIPEGAPTWLLYCYSATLGSAIALLIIAIWSIYKLQSRMATYDTGDPTVVYSCGKKHIHFNSFFDCHCRHIQRVSIFLFYLGTSVVLFAAASLQAAKFIALYDDPASAVIFGLLILVPTIVIALGRSLVPSKSHDSAVDYGGLIGVTEEDLEAAERVRRQAESFASFLPTASSTTSATASPVPQQQQQQQQRAGSPAPY